MTFRSIGEQKIGKCAIEVTAVADNRLDILVKEDIGSDRSVAVEIKKVWFFKDGSYMSTFSIAREINIEAVVNN